MASISPTSDSGATARHSRAPAAVDWVEVVELSSSGCDADADAYSGTASDSSDEEKPPQRDGRAEKRARMLEAGTAVPPDFLKPLRQTRLPRLLPAKAEQIQSKTDVDDDANPAQHSVCRMARRRKAAIDVDEAARHRKKLRSSKDDMGRVMVGAKKSNKSKVDIKSKKSKVNVKKSERPMDDVKRNRASPAGLVKLYKGFSDEKKAAVDEMGFASFGDIKCDNLHNPLLAWLATLYEPSSRSLAIPRRGKVSLREEDVREVLGLPLGGESVKYSYVPNEEGPLAAGLFPPDMLDKFGVRPKVTDIAKLLQTHTEADDTFKRLWLVYVVSAVLAPTTSNLISNKCYAFLGDIGAVSGINWCGFVADQLHGNLSKGMHNKSCLLFMMLRYIDCIDPSGYKLRDPLADGPFSVNRWTRVAVDEVSGWDSQPDGKTFGKMQLKPQFSMKMSLFGGPDGFEKWMNENTDPACPIEQREKVASLMWQFAVAMSGALCNLVQGWTSLVPSASASMAVMFGQNNGGMSANRALIGSRRSASRGRSARLKPRRELSSEDEEVVGSDDEST